jgi:hypothetical protein
MTARDRLREALNYANMAPRTADAEFTSVRVGDARKLDALVEAVGAQLTSMARFRSDPASLQKSIELDNAVHAAYTALTTEAK